MRGEGDALNKERRRRGGRLAPFAEGLEGRGYIDIHINIDIRLEPPPQRRRKSHGYGHGGSMDGVSR